MDEHCQVYRRLVGNMQRCTTVCTVRDLLHGTESEEENQGEKMGSNTIEVSNDFISLHFHLLLNRFIANRKQPLLRPKALFFTHFQTRA